MASGAAPVEYALRGPLLVVVVGEDGAFRGRGDAFLVSRAWGGAFLSMARGKDRHEHGADAAAKPAQRQHAVPVTMRGENEGRRLGRFPAGPLGSPFSVFSPSSFNYVAFNYVARVAIRHIYCVRP